MKLRQIWIIGAVTLPLSACAGSIAPEAPDYQFAVRGHYKAISDCAYLTIRSKYPEHRKVELESMNASEIVWDGGGVMIGRIVFKSAGSDRTEVTSYFRSAIYGRDFYEKRYRPLIEACAEPSAG